VTAPAAFRSSRSRYRWSPALAGLLALLFIGCRDRDAEFGFWFDPITFDSPKLNGPITPAELATIESIARSEIVTAFTGLPITFTANRNARYHIRVVQDLHGGAGQSRATETFGGSGAVSFTFLAVGALWHSTPDDDRASIIASIGRGIGRTAVHEFAHQLLPTTEIHSKNVRSYEFGSAARREQYHGPMEWDLAWPLIQKAFGVVPATSGTLSGS
jgi:hypothetical protein